MNFYGILWILKKGHLIRFILSWFIIDAWNFVVNNSLINATHFYAKTYKKNKGLDDFGSRSSWHVIFADLYQSVLNVARILEDVIIVLLTILVASIEEASSIYVIKSITNITNHEVYVWVLQS